jgi:hypothetical protein
MRKAVLEGLEIGRALLHPAPVPNPSLALVSLCCLTCAAVAAAYYCMANNNISKENVSRSLYSIVELANTLEKKLYMGRNCQAQVRKA